MPVPIADLADRLWELRGQSAVIRLVHLHQLGGRGRADRCANLGDHYGDDYEAFISDLLKPDLEKLLNHPVMIGDGEYYLPNARSHSVVDLRNMALEAYAWDEVPEAFVMLFDDDDQDESPNNIFISHRHEDAGWGRALASELRVWFGEDVFFDSDAIQAGDDIDETLEAYAQACKVMVVVVGPRWVSSFAERRSSRDDRVVMEIAAAMDVGNTVVPVRMGGASPPRSGDLPARIGRLARRNAHLERRRGPEGSSG